MSRRRGYILMEVMLAAGIFAMAGVGFAIALNNIAKTCARANELSAIRLGLSSRLAAAKLNPLISGKQTEEDVSGLVSYTKEIASLDFKQTLGDQATGLQAPMSGYYRITLTAEWKEGNDTQSEKAEIYVYQP